MRWVISMTLVAIVSGCATHAKPPAGYYANAEGKSGLALKSALHDIVNDHTVLRYSSSSFDTHDALQVLDQDPANTNNVILIYSRRSEPKSTWPDWNREHLWPNSLGIDDDMPAYSDLHNLRACDMNVNSSRGNELCMANYYSRGFWHLNLQRKAPSARCARVF